jgi:formiminoglutamate deiminase
MSERTVTWYAAGHAHLPEGVAADVRIGVSGGRITAVDRAPAQSDDARLPGLVLPGFANTHSHAFHRALRGRTHVDPDGQPGTFWTWRDQMYALAGRLDPDGYLALARATYAEMALAGVTAVGEFHYLHHASGGRRYDDPNVMSAALITAAADVGVRLTLLDACYLAGGLGPDGPRPLGREQLRFSDGTAEAWADRHHQLVDRADGTTGPDGLLIGAAIHSVRAVPRDQLPTVVTAAAGRPLHVHLSEQPAENEQCLEAYGVTPAALLADVGALSATSTAVHATHLTDADVKRLGGIGTFISMCPTTERDLGDGIGPADALRQAGCPIVLGSDQHAVLDLFEEARGLEMDERLAQGRRGCFRPAELVEALTAAGQRSIGWSDAGELAVGRRADLIAVRLDTPRTAGVDPAQAVLAATAADVDTVLVDGRLVVSGGQHHLGDVGRLLRDAIAGAWGQR